MEYYDNDIFKMRYSSLLGDNKTKKIKWTSKISNKMKKHKIITVSTIIFLLCLILNFVLIYNFFKILENC